MEKRSICPPGPEFREIAFLLSEEKAEEALTGVTEERTVFTQRRWDVSSLHSLRTKEKRN